jgi:pyrroline-5-carboxylate reductase
MDKIGFIGMGNMGYALLKGVLKEFPTEAVMFTARTMETKRRVYQETQVPYAESNAECANACKYVILAVKPQYYPVVLKQIRYAVTAEHVIISLAPGITIDSLKDTLGSDRRIVRAMPNTPALIGEGMTGLSFQKEEFSQEEIELIHLLFGAVGKYMDVEERLMSAVVCASGSSPAYVYQFIEALADGAVKYGLPRDQAYVFAAQAVAGAARMVLETGEHPAVLKDKVCSPGGTTIAGVAALEDAGMRSAVLKACDACYEKERSLFTQPLIH